MGLKLQRLERPHRAKSSKNMISSTSTNVKLYLQPRSGAEALIWWGGMSSLFRPREPGPQSPPGSIPTRRRNRLSLSAVPILSAICARQACLNSAFCSGESLWNSSVRASGYRMLPVTAGRRTAECAIIRRSNKCSRPKPQQETSEYASKRNMTLAALARSEVSGFFSTPSTLRTRAMKQCSS